MTARKWIVGVQVERGNTAGYEVEKFGFAMQHEAEAFLKAALLADNVLAVRRIYPEQADTATAEGER